MTVTVSILHHFKDLRDPRIYTDNGRHRLLDIVVIAMLAVLSGADGWAISARGRIHVEPGSPRFWRCHTASLPETPSDA